MKSALSDILVDTNVLVYAFDPRDLRKQQQATATIERLLAGERAAVSVQCLTEFFRAVRWRLPQPLGPDAALTEVFRLSLACRVLDMTPQVVLEACRASNEYQMSIWDALIWAAAKLNQIPYVLSEDNEHERVIESVRYLNPFHPTFNLSLLDARP
jgi:predicted nucleic acid-binding protein